MRKIFTLVSILFFAQASVAQNILSLTAGTIPCSGMSTCITVTTDATQAQLPLEYNLSIGVGGGWFIFPGYPQTENNSNWTICSLQAGTYLVEILDGA